MAAPIEVLNNVRVASPCSVPWNKMHGDDRVRFCSQCELHVFNLSSLSTNEAADLVLKTEGRMCVRFYRRSDGTMLTSDCPIGLRAIRRRFHKVAAAIAALFGISLGVSGCMGQIACTEETQSPKSTEKKQSPSPTTQSSGL